MYKFSKPLREALILRRRNRFIMEVEVDGVIQDCHCPSTGSIGAIANFQGIPCLIADHSENLLRKTKYTVEAISFNLPEEENKSWIGINQTQANRYVEHFLTNGSFPNMVDSSKGVQREKKLGTSRLDFLVNNTFIEVKTPLIKIQLPYPSHIEIKEMDGYGSFDRLVKHVNSLSESLDSNENAILLSCYLYDNVNFTIPKRGGNIKEIETAIKSARARGLSLWAVNFKIDKEGVSLIKYAKSID